MSGIMSGQIIEERRVNIRGDKFYDVSVLVFNGDKYAMIMRDIFDLPAIIDYDILDEFLKYSWQNKNGYFWARTDNDKNYLHNFVMDYTPLGKGAKESVDHIDRQRNNNIRKNLRIVSQSFQNRNQSKRVRKYDLPKNIHKSDNNRFEISIKFDGKKIYYKSPRTKEFCENFNLQMTKKILSLIKPRFADLFERVDSIYNDLMDIYDKNEHRIFMNDDDLTIDYENLSEKESYIIDNVKITDIVNNDSKINIVTNYYLIKNMYGNSGNTLKFDGIIVDVGAKKLLKKPNYTAFTEKASYVCMNKRGCFMYDLPKGEEKRSLTIPKTKLGYRHEYHELLKAMLLNPSKKINKSGIMDVLKKYDKTDIKTFFKKVSKMDEEYKEKTNFSLKHSIKRVVEEDIEKEFLRHIYIKCGCGITHRYTTYDCKEQYIRVRYEYKKINLNIKRLDNVDLKWHIEFLKEKYNRKCGDILKIDDDLSKYINDVILKNRHKKATKSGKMRNNVYTKIEKHILKEELIYNYTADEIKKIVMEETGKKISKSFIQSTINKKIDAEDLKECGQIRVFKRGNELMRMSFYSKCYSYAKDLMTQRRKKGITDEILMKIRELKKNKKSVEYIKKYLDDNYDIKVSSPRTMTKYFKKETLQEKYGEDVVEHVLRFLVN